MISKGEGISSEFKECRKLVAWLIRDISMVKGQMSDHLFQMSTNALIKTGYRFFDVKYKQESNQ